MFTIDKNEYRNLQEQVLKNKQDIAAHYAIDRVLAEFGIRVIGVLPTADDLDENYQGEYGDAFAIGTEPPYIFWIWTRPDPAAGHETAYWFDVGELAIVGPQGPKGDKGDKGDTGASTRWFVIYSFNELDQEPYRSMAPGNIAIIDGYTWETGEYSGLHGQTYIKGNTAWMSGPNLRGPQGLTGNTGASGAKGDKGDKGDKGEPGPAGPIVVLKGIITSMSQLSGVIPTAPNDAYLLEENGNKYIIGLVNNTWTNLGIFAGGTLVTVDSIIQNEWNADSKLDKFTEGGAYRVYTVGTQGGQDMQTLDYRVKTGTSAKYQIAVRDSESSSVYGQIRVPETPVNIYHATSKKYVDDKTTLYRHNIRINAEVSGDSATIYLTLYNKTSTPMTTVNTGGTISATGYMTLSSTDYIIYSADINTEYSSISAEGISLDGSQQHINNGFDGGTSSIIDIVTPV